MYRVRLTHLLSGGLTAALIAAPQALEHTIDTQRSCITIHVGKAGLFAPAAHEHSVNAPIASGSVDFNSAAGRIRFTVQAQELTVKPAKGVSDRDQADVQPNMHRKVLESSTYPESVFQSAEVRGVREGAWMVSGFLTLHGATRPVTVEVTRESDAYIGSARIKQTDFGIQPIKIGGGIVKVKDELEIGFRVYTMAR
jgi:polyisoprenoid-binding protein YceI